MKNKIAIIDMGTNTFHLLVAGQTDKGPYAIIYRDRVAVKIGKGGINEGYITSDGLDRALHALASFKKVIDNNGVGQTYAFGTSALRNASNGKDIIGKIKSNTGIEAQIISGDVEAEYIYKGVRSAVPMGNEKSLVVDIGGGSVECIIANHDGIFWKKSFEIGAQRLLERFHKSDPISKEEIVALDAHFETSLRPLVDSIRKYNTTTLIGASGTFDTLSEIFAYKKGISLNPEQTETPLTLDSFYEIHLELVDKNREQRSNIPGMIEMRVDMIVVASCLVHYILSKHLFKRIRVSTYSLKEGVLASMTQPTGHSVYTDQ